MVKDDMKGSSQKKTVGPGGQAPVSTDVMTVARLLQDSYDVPIASKERADAFKKCDNVFRGVQRAVKYIQETVEVLSSYSGQAAPQQQGKPAGQKLPESTTVLQGCTDLVPTNDDISLITAADAPQRTICGDDVAFAESLHGEDSVHTGVDALGLDSVYHAVGDVAVDEGEYEEATSAVMKLFTPEGTRITKASADSVTGNMPTRQEPIGTATLADVDESHQARGVGEWQDGMSLGDQPIHEGPSLERRFSGVDALDNAVHAATYAELQRLRDFASACKSQYDTKVASSGSDSTGDEDTVLGSSLQKM